MYACILACENLYSSFGVVLVLVVVVTSNNGHTKLKDTQLPQRREKVTSDSKWPPAHGTSDDVITTQNTLRHAHETGDCAGAAHAQFSAALEHDQRSREGRAHALCVCSPRDVLSFGVMKIGRSGRRLVAPLAAEHVGPELHELGFVEASVLVLVEHLHQ